MAVFFGVIGDIHGNFDALARIVGRHPDIPFWLCVGDVANAAGAYPLPAAPLYFIQGNNESFDRLAAFRAGSEKIANLYFIPNGTSVRIALTHQSGDTANAGLPSQSGEAADASLPGQSGEAAKAGLVVAGLGGTHAPSWYDTAPDQLPAKRKDDKRRHFVRQEVEACKALRGVDVLLTHEAPKPFWVDLPSSTSPTRKWRRDVGKEAITEVADAVQPRLHCFGHHHLHAHFDRAGIPTVCVDRVNRSYLLVDSGSFVWELRKTDAT